MLFQSWKIINPADYYWNSKFLHLELMQYTKAVCKLPDKYVQSCIAIGLCMKLLSTLTYDYIGQSSMIPASSFCREIDHIIKPFYTL